MGKRILIISILLIMLGSVPIRAQVDDTRANTPVPFTLADRDRIMLTEKRLEEFEKRVDERFTAMQKNMDERFAAMQKNMDERFAAMQKNIDERFAAQDKRFDDIQSDIGNIYNMMLLLLGAMFTLFGFILWDRKTTVRPVRKEQEKIIEVLRELAKEDKNIANAFHKAGLL